MVENFLLLQNHFLENLFAPKILIEKNFGRKYFIVAKSFPRKQVPIKNFPQKFFGHFTFPGFLLY